MRRWVYVLAEKWGQRPDQILDGMTSAELSEAIAYYLLVMDEQSEAQQEHAQSARLQQAIHEQRQASAHTRAMGGGTN